MVSAVAGAGVVAQSGPVRHHVFLRGGGQRGYVREALQEAVVIGDHGGHLRLLQHDLGQPDPIRVTRVLPGQIMAAVLALPGDDTRGEFHGAHYRIALLPGSGRPVTTKSLCDALLGVARLYLERESAITSLSRPLWARGRAWRATRSWWGHPDLGVET
ncbi:hypothetical protein G6F24_016765 [Rhizopus arrhizus]|nr:hypothetical protein G6F24_016765 [Rhizopus arrhizus]